MSVGILRVLRPYVERFPILAHVYRAVRDTRAFHMRSPRPTPYGFLLMGNSLMEAGTFEPEETAAIKHFLETADVFVDIGANIGLYTCLARACRKQVLAIEPLPENLAYLYANLVANAWHAGVEVYPVGLAREPGLATLYGGNTGASLIAGWSGASTVYRRTIPISTVDILVGRRFEGRTLLIKVDVEGAEYDLLQGAEQTLTISPPPVWVVEIMLAEHHPNSFNQNYVKTFDMFWKHGYEAFTASRSRRRVSREDVEGWARRGGGKHDLHSFLFTKVKAP